MTPVLTQLRFLAAAQAWLETRRPYIAPKTFREYTLNIKTLNVYFADFRLNEITSDQIRAFQRARMAQCGPHSINHECSVLQQMMKRIGRWPELAADFQPLPLPKKMRGRALREEERERLFRIAKSKPEWEGVYAFGLISINTTAGPKEAMTLRLKDVDLDDRTMTVQPEGAKNVHRVRRIPLNDEAMLGVKLAIKRAKSLGSVEPEHYIFPFRKNKGDTYDPTRAQTTFKTAWRHLRIAANLPGFRLYDLRHHGITALLENPANSEETIEAIAGHIGRATKKIYSHPRMEAQRKAVETLLMRGIKKPVRSEKKADSDDSAKLGTELLAALAKLLKQQG